MTMFCLLDVPPFLFVQKTKAEEHVVSGYYEIPEHPSLEKVVTPDQNTKLEYQLSLLL